jgi:ABC-3C protein
VAPGQTAGYIYQCRYGLLAGLQRAGSEPQLSISLEFLDDVAFHAGEDAFARLQLKHHLNRAAKLTDACPDLWKTLAIWAGEVAIDPSRLASRQLLLVTTATAPSGSASGWLRGNGRDVGKALELLLAATEESASRSNSGYYAAFRALARDTQTALLRSVEIVDGSPSLSNLENDLLRELRLAVPAGSREAALRRLEGWWWSRISEALDRPDRKLISLLEIEACLDGIREDCRIQDLPVEFATAIPPPATAEGYDRRRFVHQIRLIDCPLASISHAKRDYYRAFEQRSKWSREYLTRSEEITRFEGSLIEQWEPRFERMVDELARASEEEKDAKDRGRELLHWMETDARASLRNVTERYLTVGSYHMLADDRRVGWHPDYDKLTRSAPGDEGGRNE